MRGRPLVFKPERIFLLSKTRVLKKGSFYIRRDR
jgi:hypothetical protein